ncbi:CocE/NonD family hydrolase [Thermopolyspora sp. NPDC052614]|uniref:CocE/NonD family hydrolase n=1 Tax=Thermopolyspora sp. NPDC052614 TaxID=3155682 RepID=UPI0034238B62
MIERSEVITAGDGVPLATDHCLPDGPGPFPCVLIRTPYDRRAHAAELRAWARRGFAAVVQDVRGRHGSGGRWRPYRDEADDGAATVRALRREPWCDGAIVACGASYAAHCALAVALHPDATARPDAVIAAVPALGPAETARETTGVERLLARAGWWAAHGDRRDSDPCALDRALAADPALLDHLPVLDLPRRLGRPLPSWERLWAARRSGDPAGTIRIGPGDDGPRAESGAIPLLAVGGSRDAFAADTLTLWRAWGRQGAGAARLLLGPWGHILTANPGPGTDEEHALALGPLYAEFARAALSGALRGRRGAVAIEGAGHWLSADEYAPPARVIPMDGTDLGLRVLRGEEFVADPERPMRSDHLGVPVRGRPDRLLALGDPLPTALDLAGDAEARILATADTPSADWAVRLVLITPRGTAEPLATGIARSGAPTGARVPIRVPLGPLFRRLPAGVRLRVEIAGHHFPAHARNPHTGQDPLRATVLRPSLRTVDPGGSHVALPVLDSAAALRSIDPAEEILR